MTSETLKILGQIAGIGGIALGVLLIIFRDFLKKNIFAKLTKEQSFRLLRLLLILVWSVAIVGIVAWLWASLANGGNTEATTTTNGEPAGKFEITDVITTPNE